MTKVADSRFFQVSLVNFNSVLVKVLSVAGVCTFVCQRQFVRKVIIIGNITASGLCVSVVPENLTN